MMHVLEIQSGAQHLYNCIKSAIDFGIIDTNYNNGKLVKFNSQSCKYNSNNDDDEYLYKCYIDRLYEEFTAYALYYHRSGECTDTFTAEA